MANYWCVNFDADACLRHGIDKRLWLMQFQYADKQNPHQSDKKWTIPKNWERLGEIGAGDRFVAYLKSSRFYAIGKVITPRRIKTPQDPSDTIENYLRHQHNRLSGYVYYTPVFYEDFTDKWRRSKRIRYPQRIDVDEWQHYVSDGVEVKGLSGVVKPSELRKAAFEIPEAFFKRIESELSRHDGQSSGEQEAMEDVAVQALERSCARRQGFLLDSARRKAIEEAAMAEARRYFEKQGYVVEDHSKNQPYDLQCTRNSKKIFVEVKGTHSKGQEVFLTANEVTFARRHKQRMSLFLLHSINVSGDGKILADGQKQVLLPWDVDRGSLEPMAYKYEVPRATSALRSESGRS